MSAQNYQQSRAFINIGRILEHIRAENFTKAKLLEFLSFFDTPGDLKRLFIFVGQMEPIYLILGQGRWDSCWSKPRTAILATQPLCLALHENELIVKKKLAASKLDQHKELITHLSVDFRRKKYTIHNKLFHGMTKDYPLYAALGHVQAKGHYDTPFRQLKSYLTLSHAVIQDLPPSVESTKLTEQLMEACDALRSIARDEDSKDLALVPPDLKSPENLVQIAQKFPEAKNIQTIALLIESTREILKNRISLHGKGLRGKSYLPLPPNLFEGKDFQSGLDGADELPGNFDILPGRRGLDWIDNFRAGQISKHIARDNLQSQLDRNALSRRDLEILLQALTGNLPDIKIFPGPRAMLHLMRELGWGADRISRARLGLPPVDQAELEADYYDPEKKKVHVFTPHPTLKTAPSSEAKHQLVPRRTTIELPLSSMAVKALDDYLAIRPKSAGSCLFPTRPKKVLAICDAYIKTLRRQYSCALTLKRIQRHLDRVQNKTGIGDAALTILSRGIEIHQGEIKCHYLSADSYQCISNHVSAENSILGRYGYPPIPEPDVWQESHYVGTPKRPTLEAVQELIESLQEKLLSYGPAPSFKDEAEHVEYHNLYLAYTVLVLAFSLGFRAVIDPGITEDGYDPVTGFAVIRDKDTWDMAHKRLVWLAQVCRDHLLEYLAYRRNFVENCKLTDAQKSLLGQKTLFFLELKKTKKGSRIHIKDVRPKSLQKILKGLGYHPEINANRHFLKSNLQERGCTSTVIEAFLGHWLLGEEPFTGSSSLHPEVYRRELEQHLPPLLNQIGIIPVAGIQMSGPRLDIAKVACSKKDHPPNPKMPDDPPGELWWIAKGNVYRSERSRKGFTRHQRVLLAKIHRRLPELYRAPANLTTTQEEIDDFYYALARSDAKTGYKQQTFLYRFLATAQKTHQWPITLPVKPRIIRRERNLLANIDPGHFAQFRALEQAFLADCRVAWTSDGKDRDSNYSRRLAQILLSAVFYGPLLHLPWLECVPRGLANWVHQYQDWLWVDLWRGEPPSDDFTRFQEQQNPDKYRRWVVDPHTQGLIYRLREQFPKDLDRPSVDAKTILWRYLKELGFSPKRENQWFLSLSRLAKARAVTCMPPFLVAYATGQQHSASLPDPAWIRAITGLIVPNLRPKTPEPPPMPRPPAFWNPPRKLVVSEHYRLLIKEIKDGDPSRSPRERVETFFDKHRDELCRVTYLLCGFAFYLFSHKKNQGKASYKKGPLKITSVTDYLHLLWEPLVAVFGDEDRYIYEIDPEDLRDAYREILDLMRTRRRPSAKATDAQKAQAEAKAEGALLRFHNFLSSVFDACPFPPGITKRLRNNRVRANLLTETDLQRLLSALNYQNRDASRLEKIAGNFVVISRRTGARPPSEGLGLRVRDLEGDPWLDIRIRPYRGHTLKSRQANRRAPFDLLAVAEELKTLKDWHQERKGELQVKSKDLLFTLSPLHKEMLAEEDLAEPLRKAIKKVIADDAAVPYDLRHSFYTEKVWQLMSCPDIDTPTLPYYLTVARPLSDELREIIDGNDPTGRDRLRTLSILMGHVDVATGLHSYCHLTDWLLGYYSRHPAALPLVEDEALGDEALRTHLGLTQGQIAYQRRVGKAPFPHAVYERAKHFAGKLEHPLVAKALKKPPRLKKVFPSVVKPGFEEAYEASKASLDSSSLPKSGAELDLVCNAYETIAQLHPRSRARLTTNAQNLAGNMQGATLRLETYEEARQAFEFLAVAGFPLEDLSFGYRGWRQKNNRHRNLSRLFGWRIKFPDREIQELPVNRSTGGWLEIRHKAPIGKRSPLSLLPIIAGCLDQIGLKRAKHTATPMETTSAARKAKNAAGPSYDIFQAGDPSCNSPSS